jgi:site-specific DNA-adenine methylase
MNYGIPYMGSKSKICDNVCALFPRADNFYDLFGGGFSISHFMIKHRSNHYKEFHFNELRSGICEMVKDAINGKYNYNVFKPEWISRERFFAEKESNPYIKIIWSFGNEGGSYLFGKEIEQDKKSMHMAVVFNEFDDYAVKIFGTDKFKDGFGINEKRLYLKNRLRLLKEKRLDLQQLERLEQLQQLERLQQLEQLERIKFYNNSYEKIPIKQNSIIYCDPPYKGTADYESNFNTEKFLNWAHEQSEPVFISEYQIDDNRFKCIANFEKRSLLSSSKEKTLIKTERVYVNKAGYNKMMGARNG